MSTHWTLDAGMPVFAGHFPAHPVLPGALLLDWVIGAIDAQSESRVEAVTQVKFPHAALPGDGLHLDLQHAGTRVRFEVRATRQLTSPVVASGVACLASAARGAAP